MSIHEMQQPSSSRAAKGRYLPRATDSCTSLLRCFCDGLVIPNGLVVSSDYDCRAHLGEALLLCAVAPLFASNLREAIHHVSSSPMSVVVCDERLPDGTYKGLLPIVKSLHPATPTIVISPAGDWPDYFEALDLGAYDFLPFPLIPGELPRIVRNYLESRFSVTSPANPLD